MSFPKTVQAIAIDKQGDLDVLEKKTLPFPEQGPQDLVVKVRIKRFQTLSWVLIQWAV